MNTPTRSALLVLTGGLLWGAAVGRAQGVFFVTGVSRPGTVTLVAPDETALDLTVGRSISPGTVRVVADAKLMFFEPSGVVAIVFGPAELTVVRDELRDEIVVGLESGRLVLAAARPPESTPTIFVRVEAAAPQPAVEVQADGGRTYVSRSDAGVSVGYEADGGAEALAVRVGTRRVNVPGGQRLTVAGGGAPEVVALGDWLSQSGFTDDWGRELGVESARESRVDVEANLFGNIIAWDRYAGAGHVVPRLQPPKFDPEIRQTVQTVTTPVQSNVQNPTVQTVVRPDFALNEVPPLSPAGASVQNIRDLGAGVTAITLNAQGRTYLVLTGSQGLGFRGLLQLAIPGFSDGGTRTLGPAGLGAQP
ncbi:MAG: hypothetical protein KA383_02895 [Phycisphaerae bacterium]|nr:hypothetical protein [Phycisphaerae bacterium]